jgi:hypothetical protein
MPLATADQMLRTASRCLLDPEQTAVAPEVAHPLGTFLASLTHVALLSDLATPVATAIVHHEHERLVNPPAEATETALAAADLLDKIATSFAHGAVPDMDDESGDAAYRFLIQCRDDLRAGRPM